VGFLAKGNTLLLIALASGSTNQRLTIADALVGSGKSQLVAYSQTTPGANDPARRTQILRSALEGLEAASVRTDPKPRHGGLIVTHCLTELEAQAIRARGGVIWHLYGPPSGAVIIYPADVMVSIAPSGAPAHVFTPLEALSELMFLHTLPTLRNRRRASPVPAAPGILHLPR
jgi:hypothetical protein